MWRRAASLRRSHQLGGDAREQVRLRGIPVAAVSGAPLEGFIGVDVRIIVSGAVVERIDPLHGCLLSFRARVDERDQLLRVPNERLLQRPVVPTYPVVQA